MTQEVSLDANVRKDFSSSRLNSLRSEGKIPAVLYGQDIKNTVIFVDEKEFKKSISTERGENALIKLKVEKKNPVTTIVKEIQVNPVSMKIIHVDFVKVKLQEALEVEVPVEVEGESPGVKTGGGVLEHIIRKIKVRCLPNEIPDNFILNVSELDVGENLKISDIPKIKGIEILAEEDAIVVNVVSPSEYEEPEEKELAEEEEPEVIKKEEKPEEEEKSKEEESAGKEEKSTSKK